MGAAARTKQGVIEGFTEDGIFKFLDVPYAEPPVGERRWRLPFPIAGWAGVRKAEEFGPICPQTAGAVFQTRAKCQSEDCLYLNVWTSSASDICETAVLVKVVTSSRTTLPLRLLAPGFEKCVTYLSPGGIQPPICCISERRLPTPQWSVILPFWTRMTSTVSKWILR